jgi:hypothetical protein
MREKVTFELRSFIVERVLLGQNPPPRCLINLLVVAVIPKEREGEERGEVGVVKICAKSCS